MNFNMAFISSMASSLGKRQRVEIATEEKRQVKQTSPYKIGDWVLYCFGGETPVRIININYDKHYKTYWYDLEAARWKYQNQDQTSMLLDVPAFRIKSQSSRQ